MKYVQWNLVNDGIAVIKTAGDAPIYANQFSVSDETNTDNMKVANGHLLAISQPSELEPDA